MDGEIRIARTCKGGGKKRTAFITVTTVFIAMKSMFAPYEH